jgi:carbon monoxide dehydrogenase subunit G
MLLTNEFVVAADVDTVWRHLLDMEEVAECVPGAKVEEVVPPGTYRGKIRLKIGPMTVEYRGEATLLEVDEDARRATIQMKAREARGQGSALATVRNSLAAVPEGTRVRAETELEITGPQAQFGKGVLEDVGGRILEEFTARLERRIAAAQYGSGNEEEASSARGASFTNGDGRSAPSERASSRSFTEESEDTLDLNRVLVSSLRARGVKVATVVVAMLAVGLAIWGWRRREV